MMSVLEAAEEARRRGRVRKAIAGYRRVLAEHPEDVSVHARLAPLLAKKGRLAEALQSFVAAAEHEVERGFLDKAIGLYQSAARYLPREASLWRKVAELHQRRERFADAIAALEAGARKCEPAAAVELLTQALELDPYRVALTIELADALRKAGRRPEARRMLEDRLAHAETGEVRPLRAALWRAHPTPVTLWRWLRA